MPITVYTEMQQRRDTVAHWTSVNPVPLAGEICVSMDTNPLSFKIGDGVTNWVNLPYFSSGGGNTWWVMSGQTITISIGTENICTSPQIVDGILIVNGRNTII